MKHRISLFCVIFTVSQALAVAAPEAQQRYDGYQAAQRLDRLEQDFMLLQKQLAQGGVIGAAGSASAQGRLGSNVAEIGEQIRDLRGQIERLEYDIKQVQRQQQRFQEDNDFRLQEMERKMVSFSAITPTENDQGLTIPAAQGAQAEREENLTSELQSVVEGSAPVTPATPIETAEGRPITQAAPERLAIPDPNGPVSARDLYNEGFAQLNQTNYTGAEKAFRRFTDEFAKDPLIGNAWYWLGETYYVRRDYVKAADSFRQGFEKLPDGPKAGDNLLKLAMSLAALEKTKESCVVLRQVEKRFGADSAALKEKSAQEINRLGCK